MKTRNLFVALVLAISLPVHSVAADELRLTASEWRPYANSAVLLNAVGIFVAGFSCIFTAINFIVSIHKMRAPGMTWFRLPRFIWAMYATSLIIILGTPVLPITLLLVGVERGWQERQVAEGQRIAGVRTYGLIGLLGGASALPATSGISVSA